MYRICLLFRHLEGHLHARAAVAISGPRWTMHAMAGQDKPDELLQ